MPYHSEFHSCSISPFWICAKVFRFCHESCVLFFFFSFYSHVSQAHAKSSFNRPHVWMPRAYTHTPFNSPIHIKIAISWKRKTETHIIHGGIYQSACMISCEYGVAVKMKIQFAIGKTNAISDGFRTRPARQGGSLQHIHTSWKLNCLVSDFIRWNSRQN